MGINEVLVVNSLEQIKALSSPYRIKIIETFDNKPASAKDISSRMGEPHGRVNYHIKTLAKVGILKLVDVSVKQGVVEKYYMPVAESIVLDSRMVNKNENHDVKDMRNAGIALYEKISKEFYATMNSKDMKIQKKINYDYDFYLTEEEADTLNAKIQEMVDDFLKDKEEPREGAHRYFTASMIIPMALGEDIRFESGEVDDHDETD
jgi:predicted transcriptional regulator